MEVAVSLGPGGDAVRKRLREEPGFAIRLIGIAALATAVVLIGLDVAGLAVDAGTAGLLVLAAAFLASVVAPREIGAFLERISTFKVAGVEVALGERQRAERVLARLPEREDDVDVPPRPKGGGAIAEVLEVRHELERKLRYVRDHLLETEPDKMAYGDVVRRLRREELLTADEISVVFYLFGDSAASWPEAERDRFLDAGWQLSVRLGTQVFERRARNRMAAAGLAVVDFKQNRKHRRDFLVEGDRRYLVATRVADPWTGMKGVRERLEREKTPNAKPVVVVPDRTEIVADGIAPEVAIMKLSDFLALATASAAAA